MKYVLKGIMIAIVIALIVLGLGFVTMHLWNWLMPAIFGLKIISFHQAIGLLILCKILFGGFHKGRHRHCGHRGWRGHHYGPWRKRWEEKMANMTPEEKEKFRRGWEKCGWNDWEEEKKQESNT